MGRWLLGALVVVAVGGMMAGSVPADARTRGPTTSASPSASVDGEVGAEAAGTALANPSPSATTSDPGVTLGIGVAPAKICADLAATCPAATGLARVTLTANAATSGPESWPAVQVAFVLETTVYDGTADAESGDYGSDPCMPSTSLMCEESNGVPFFVANSQLIASEIQSANPHSKVSFALVDYFATLTDHDDGDGSEYHVDLQDFVPSAEFGAAVTSTFQAQVLHGGWIYSDSDLADNTLDTSSITALYGTIIGSDLTWSNHTHHVIVWMGSSAPRDPNYLVDYGVSANDFLGSSSGQSWSSGCEPSYAFPTGASPDCEGWVRSQDGNSSDSIAALARSAPSCTDSIGGVCTVDTIDYWTTPTDYESLGWPTGPVGGGPGGSRVIQDVDHIIEAGCDMAAATGGSWDGPSGLSCPDGQAGNLEYVPHGAPNDPDTSNPTLLQALRGIGFGPVIARQVAAAPHAPMFEFVPIGSIAIPPANQLQGTAACVHDGAFLRTCQMTPTREVFGNTVYLAWNWSTTAASNILQLGDSWTASFNVYSTAPTPTPVPVDACTTTACRFAGSAAVNGLYTSMDYVPASNTSVVRASFPLGQVAVEATPALPTGAGLPSGGGPAPGVPVASANALPVSHPAGIGNPLGLSAVNLQAIAAGMLSAGLVRVGVRHRAMGVKVAHRTGVVRSKFEVRSTRDPMPEVGRFD